LRRRGRRGRTIAPQMAVERRPNLATLKMSWIDDWPAKVDVGTDMVTG